MKITINGWVNSETFDLNHLSEEEQRKLVSKILDIIFDTKPGFEVPQKKISGKPYLEIVKK